MRVHCPHCLEEIEVGPKDGPTLLCSYCKAEFDVRSKETLAQAPEPKRNVPSGVQEGDRFGQYAIIRRIGKGGMGAVFLAKQTNLDRQVALKILSHDLTRDPQFVQRFEREAKALATLSHPNIVSVIDRGEERGTYYLVMEYVEGASLRELLSHGPIPPADALRIVPQICDALEYAHSKGIVHRDIKPENILIDRSGRVKIADFGLAKITGTEKEKEPRITRTHTVMGSVDYMAPEQRESSRDVDHRADIFSLGVVFYELLTGELPLGRFAPPSKKVAISIELDEVILKVLEKDPERRYQHASDVKTDVERAGTSKERPDRTLEPLASFARRHLPGRTILYLSLAWMGLWAVLAGGAPHGSPLVGLIFGAIAAAGYTWFRDAREHLGRPHPRWAAPWVVWLGLFLVVGCIGHGGQAAPFIVAFSVVAYLTRDAVRHARIAVIPEKAAVSPAPAAPADVKAVPQPPAPPAPATHEAPAPAPERRTSKLAVLLFIGSLVLFFGGVVGVLMTVVQVSPAFYDLVRTVNSQDFEGAPSLVRTLSEFNAPGIEFVLAGLLVGLAAFAVLLLVTDLIAFARAGGPRKGRLLVFLGACLQAVFVVAWLAAAGVAFKTVNWWDASVYGPAREAADRGPGPWSTDVATELRDGALASRGPAWRRALMARALGELPADAATGPLVRVANESREWEVRSVALVNLGRVLGEGGVTPDEEVLETFRAGLLSREPGVAWAACRGLALADGITDGRDPRGAAPATQAVLDRILGDERVGLDPLQRIHDSARWDRANEAITARIKDEIARRFPTEVEER